ncbi:MAG: hypothetical protein OXG19_09575 [Chloroflexi bacterium]|nr:hypothetical protein [Chloroflexota bacterium]
MESDALPYVLFLVLAELALGASMVMLAVDLRGNATVGFVRATALMVPPVMGLALWLALELDGVSVNGYRLDTGPRDAIAVLLAVATGLSALYPALLYGKRPRAGRVAAGFLAALALVVLVLLAVMLRLPAWNFGLVFASLLAGTLTLGLAAIGLSLGHWYLVTPRLPAKPLNEVTFLLLVLLAVQVLLLVLAVVAPVDERPAGGRDVAIEANRAFWLRVGVGLAFTLVLGWMAWSSSRIRSMMSATGLLYLVTGAVLAGELLARALLFDSGRAV